MADDSIDYIKSVSPIRTDIPEGPIVYPGKPINQARSSSLGRRKSVVEEEAVKPPDYIASEHNFKPVASVRFPDKNIHVVPLSNTKIRSVTPIGLSGSVTLPVRGERVFDIGDGLRTPLEKRLSRVLEKTSAKIAGTTGSNNQAQPAAGVESGTERVLTELERLRALALQELSRRRGQKLEIRPLNTKSGSAIEEKPQAHLGRSETNPSAEPTPGFINSENEPMSRLITEAERLKQELGRLQQNLSSPEAVGQQNPPASTFTTSGETDQTAKLITDRNKLVNKINELALAYQQEEVLRKNAESRLYSLTEELNTRLARLQAEKDDLQKRLAGLEKTRTTPGREVVGQIESLKQLLARSESENSRLRSKIQQLEILVQELRSAKKIEQRKEGVIPQESTQPEIKTPTARIIKPQVAVGKMAPPLTNAPNVINGIIKDSKGMLLSNAVIVVKNDSGEPVRALKTNKIGQFAISTPLPNGTYIMEIEHPDHSFDLIQVEVKGQVMPPIEIRSNN